MKFSLNSKYKNLSNKDKCIQKIFECIIAKDCILIVSELLEYTLKDFLKKHTDVCCECVEDCEYPIRVEWYFGKLIYRILNKLQDLFEKSLFFGSLINSSDIYIRDIDIKFNEKIDPNLSMSKVEKEIEFVFTNPFFYEIETIFKLVNNTGFPDFYPPEILCFFEEDPQTHLITKIKGRNLFRLKEEKKNLTEIDENKKILNQRKSKLDNTNSNNFNNELNEIPGKSKRHNLRNIAIPVENINLVQEEIYFLINNKQKILFDSWFVGMLIYDIIFNELPIEFDSLKEAKEFFFPNLNLKDKIGSKIGQIIKVILPGLDQEEKNDDEKKLLNSNKITFNYRKYDISHVMREFINMCLKSNPDERVYPSFKDCDEEIFKRIFINDDSKFGISKINESKSDNSYLNLKDYDEKAKEFVILKHDYEQFIMKKEDDIDIFHGKFFLNFIRDPNIEENELLKLFPNFYTEKFVL